MIRVTMRKVAMEEFGTLPHEYAFLLWDVIFKQWPKHPPCHPALRLSSPRSYFVIVAIKGVNVGVSLLCPRDGDCAFEGNGLHCPYAGMGSIRITSISSPFSPVDPDADHTPIWLIPDD
jgi:hypothetical protein